MENLNYKLIEAYKNNDLVNYLKYMDEYIKLGYGFDFETILCYTKIISSKRKYDEAYKILQLLENQVNKYDIATEICKEYIYCYKPVDAYRLYNSKNITFEDKSLLIRMLLLHGKVEEAEDILNKISREKLSFHERKKIEEYKLEIQNYHEFGSFIETEYSCFLQNGNKLEKGHIVFLKNRPASIVSNQDDEKASKRPYLIWKIDGDSVYMFPVESQCSRKDIILSKDKYHNSFQDRKIKDSMCQTTLNNILTVKDKVLAKDFKKILDNSFKTLYFGDRRQHDESFEFMRYYLGSVDEYDIIEYVDVKTRESRYYFVIDDMNFEYKAVEVDINENKVIDYEVKKVKDIFRIIKIEDKQKKNYIQQINDNKKKKSLSWKKVISKNIKYIVLTEVNGICYCINDAYSPSYIQCIEINKEDIDCIVEEVTKEEILRIRELLKQSDTKNGVKKKIKELIY